MYINHFSTRHPLTSTPTCSLCPTCSSCMAGRGMADPKQSYGVGNFLVPTAARVWGKELLWYVTVVSWGQGSRVCSVSFPGKNRGHDCHGVTWNCCLLFSPAQIECKWLAVTDNFIPLMTSGSSGVIDPFLKSEYLLLVLMAFLGSGFWCPKKLWVSVNMSPRWGRVKKKAKDQSCFLFQNLSSRVWVPSDPEASACGSAVWISFSFRDWLGIAMLCHAQLHLVICWMKQLKNPTAWPPHCLQVNCSEY